MLPGVNDGHCEKARREFSRHAAGFGGASLTRSSEGRGGPDNHHAYPAGPSPVQGNESPG